MPLSSYIPGKSLYRRTSLVCALLFVCSGTQFCHGQSAGGRVSAGGLQRYKSGEWGIVEAQYYNETQADQKITSIVSQPTGARNQYARSTIVPPNTLRKALWPIFVEPTNDTSFEFEYMTLTETNGRETIKRREGDQMLESFVSAAGSKSSENPGYCLHLLSDGLPQRENRNISHLMSGLRADASLPQMALSTFYRKITGQPEALGGVDQMIISASDLHQDPETCETVRFWIQRGGRALVMMNSMGEQSLRALLGDALTFAVVDQTSPMTVSLKHHVQTGGLLKETDLSYERTFEEPISMTRAVFENGRVVWSIDGWPMLVKLRLGSGTVYVATISTHMFLKDETDIVKLAPAARQIAADLFKAKQEPPLLSSASMASAAHSRIGYTIPTRTLPIVVLGLFLLALGLAGWILAKKERQTWLSIAAPAIALLATVPGIAVGLASRTTAATTLLETRIVDASPGQSAYVADGVTTIFQPESDAIPVKLNDSASLRSLSAGKNRSRFAWSDIGSYEWQNFQQPVGITDYTQRSIVRLEEPLTAQAELDGEGLKIQLSNSAFLQPHDAIIASPGSERMEARVTSEGILESSLSDRLTPGEISNGATISEEQIERRRLYQELFVNEDRLKPFPLTTSLLFWTNQLPGAIETSEELRHESATLMIVPLHIKSPAIDETITLPPALLPYESVRDSDGSVGSAYFNRRRRWIERRNASSVVLKFSVPEACHPFEFETAEIQLRIRAGSRNVEIETGRVGDFSTIETLNSPVGSFAIDLPVEALNSASNESVFLRVNVGETVSESDSPDDSAADMDNNWIVERLLLTATGHKAGSLNTENKEAK